MSKKIATTRPTWVFDDSPIPDPGGYGERAVKFFSALKHPLSEEPGRYMVLPRFWQRIIKRIYARDANGRRIVSRVVIMAPRGSRKTTTIIAGGALLHTAGPERVERGQIVLASGSKEQSEFGLEEAKAIVGETPLLRKAVRVRGDYIQHVKSGSKARIIASVGDYRTGGTPVCVFWDEFQNTKDRSLIRALKTGLAKRKGPLFVITMNSGRGHNSPAWEEYQFARRVALGETGAPYYLPILFEPDDPHADPSDERLWHYTNPGLADGWPVIEEMRTAYAEAKEKPGELDDFKNLNLGFWLENARSAFVDMRAYDECANDESGEPVPVDIESLRSTDPIWLGVDASAMIDLTSIIAAWRDGEGGYFVKPWFFCPEDNLQEREERTGAPYREWKRLGLLTATPGNVVDFDIVAEKIKSICARHAVQEVAFDPYMARWLLNEMQKAGVPAVEHRPGKLSLMGPLAEVERAVTARRLRHGGHPILRFCFANAECERNNFGHPQRLHKSKQWLSIDGAVATAFAVGRAFLAEPQPEPKKRSLFEDREAIARIFGVKLEEA